MHVRQLLETLGQRPRKRFSQNFLTSPHWAEKLVLAALGGDPPRAVWEIGPGLGALTREILAKSTVAPRLFEIDRGLCAYLRNEFPALEITEGDFLRWEGDVPDKLVVIGNLPYHISSAIFFRLVEWREKTLKLVLTFQREYAERILSRPNAPDYGALSVVAQSLYEVSSLGILPPGAFHPKPDVDSQALIFVPKPLDCDRKEFSALVRQAFSQRRKTLANNLSGLLPRDRLESWLGSQGLGASARAQELEPARFSDLTRLVREIAEGGGGCYKGR